MKQGLSEIVLVLDRSGSMSMTKADAEGGVREFVRKQKLLPGEARLTFYRFDQEIERVFEDRRLQDVFESELRLEPRGSTALLDAINRAIDEVGSRLSGRAEWERPEHVYVVIVTDGYENASRTPKSVVFDKIKTQREQFKWEFVYIGANQDAIATASQYGLDAGHTISYRASRIGTQSVYASLNENITRSRLTGESVNFTAEDRTSAMEK